MGQVWRARRHPALGGRHGLPLSPGDRRCAAAASGARRLWLYPRVRRIGSDGAGDARAGLLLGGARHVARVATGLGIRPQRPVPGGGRPRGRSSHLRPDLSAVPVGPWIRSAVGRACAACLRPLRGRSRLGPLGDGSEPAGALAHSSDEAPLALFSAQPGGTRLVEGRTGEARGCRLPLRPGDRIRRGSCRSGARRGQASRPDRDTRRRGRGPHDHPHVSQQDFQHPRAGLLVRGRSPTLLCAGTSAGPWKV